MLSQGLDGVKEPGDIHIEGDHRGAGDGLAKEAGVLNVTLCSEIEQAHLAGYEEHVHHRPENAEDVHPVDLGFGQALALFLKFLVFLLLPVEDLGDFHAGEVLGQIGIHIGGGVADTPVYPTGELAEDHREQHHEGHEAQNHQRQRIVQQQHGCQHTHDDHAVLSQCHDDVGEEEADVVGVIGDAGHQLAHGDIVELLVGELLDVGKYVQTQLGQDLLAGLLQDHGLQVGADQTHDQNACVDGHQSEQVVQFKGVFDGVLNVADEQGGQQVIDDGKQHHEEDDDEVFPVGLAVGQQPADDLAVGHMPLAVVKFFLALLQSDVGEDKY